MSEVHSEEDRYELLRTTSEEHLADVVEVLNAASVPHRVSSPIPEFDFMAIGRGDVPADMLITVALADAENARTVLEKDSVASDLPEDHFLRTASPEDLLEILSAPDEWDPFVVAHARRMAAERAIDVTTLAEKAANHAAELRLGRPAPRWMEIVGWASALIGSMGPSIPPGIFTITIFSLSGWICCLLPSVAGIGIGYSMAFMSRTAPEGKFPQFDEVSRRNGKYMMGTNVVMILAWRVVLTVLRSRDGSGSY